MPGQPHWLIGAELLGVGATAWTIITVLQRRAAQAYAANHPLPLTGQERLLTAALIVLGQLASLPFAVAGALLLLGNDAIGSHRPIVFQARGVARPHPAGGSRRPSP